MPTINDRAPVSGGWATRMRRLPGLAMYREAELGTDASACLSAALTVRNPLKLGRKEKGQLSARNGDEHDGSKLSMDSEGGIAWPSKNRRTTTRRRRALQPDPSRSGHCSSGGGSSARTTSRGPGRAKRDREADRRDPRGNGSHQRAGTHPLPGRPLHMPVVDLRRNNPQPDVLKLVPEQVVRSTRSCRSCSTTTACKSPFPISHR